jgi:hypothetical protein
MNWSFDDQPDQMNYSRLSKWEVAGMLRAISSILLPTVRTAQQAGQDWTVIVQQIQTSPDDEVKLALSQFESLLKVGCLDDEDGPRRAAGLSLDDIVVLCGLLPVGVMLDEPRLVEGRLIKNAIGRYAIEGDPNPDYDVQSGDPIELYLYDRQAEEWQWVKTYIDHQDGDYYAAARPDVKLAGVTACRWSSF